MSLEDLVGSPFEHLLELTFGERPPVPDQPASIAGPDGTRMSVANRARLDAPVPGVDRADRSDEGGLRRPVAERIAQSGQLALMEGCTTDVSLSQWFTPPAIALRMAQLLADGMTHPDGALILEPAAGSGSLVAAARLAIPRCTITAHEIDPSWVGHLRAFERTEVKEGDYLKAPAPCGEHRWYGGALLNTPFEKGQDAAFLEKAMAESHTVVALLRLVALTGVNRFRQVWSQVLNGPWSLEELRLFTRRPKFGDGGGAKSDFCVVRLRFNGRDSTNVGWW